jgi:hypothetical protein
MAASAGTSVGARVRTPEAPDRGVNAAGGLSEHQVNAIRNARVPDQYADLDKEI